ncbi:MAG: hypothetical protein Ct9H300mP17_14190 [Candidatus Nitrosopelagicus sp.]|nr:MAG: hypothetical protein Ct9H300mP17_14190 [Candidatus Nitrosopelagicus sp.]
MTPMSFAEPKLLLEISKAWKNQSLVHLPPKSALSPIIVKTNNDPSMAPIISAAK